MSKFNIQCDIWCDIFVNCSWLDTRWQQCSTNLHTNNTQNDTKQTTQRTTQQFGTVLAVPHHCGFYPGTCLTTEEKAHKNLSQGCRKMPAGMMMVHKHTIRIHRHNNEDIYVTVLKRNTTIYTLIKNRNSRIYNEQIHIAHISSNNVLIISLRPSLHCNTSLHFTTLLSTTLHCTYRHITSFHSHFTILSFGFTHLHFLSFYFTSHHKTIHSAVLISKLISKISYPRALRVTAAHNSKIYSEINNVIISTKINIFNFSISKFV